MVLQQQQKKRKETIGVGVKVGIGRARGAKIRPLITVVTLCVGPACTSSRTASAGCRYGYHEGGASGVTVNGCEVVGGSAYAHGIERASSEYTYRKGVSRDTAAIQAAINNPLCDKVSLTCERDNNSNVPCVFVTGTLKLRSNLVVQIPPETTLRGANTSVYAMPEPNPFDIYQDFGHSHWHNSLIYGTYVRNVTICGGGTIDGGGGLFSSEPDDGYGDKALSFMSSEDIRIHNISLLRTGHFGVLATNVSNMVMLHMHIEPTRDGIDLVSCNNFYGSELFVGGGGDDAFVIKSDYSLGTIIHSNNITLENSHISTNGASALEIGSETVGDFSMIRFRNIRISSAGDAAMGMAIMDGGAVSDVSYNDIFVSGSASPIQFYIGGRQSGHPRGTGRTVGSIQNVLVSNVHASNMSDPYHPGPPRNWTAVLDGMPPVPGISNESMVGPNITIRNVELCFRGGGTARGGAGLDPPHPAETWFKTGPWPSWGFFIRRATGITIKGTALQFDVNDDRPAVVLQEAPSISLANVTAKRGENAKYDVIVRIGSPGLEVSGGNLSVHKSIMSN